MLPYRSVAVTNAWNACPATAVAGPVTRSRSAAAGFTVRPSASPPSGEEPIVPSLTVTRWPPPAFVARIVTCATPSVKVTGIPVPAGTSLMSICEPSGETLPVKVRVFTPA